MERVKVIELEHNVYIRGALGGLAPTEVADLWLQEIEEAAHATALDGLERHVPQPSMTPSTSADAAVDEDPQEQQGAGQHTERAESGASNSSEEARLAGGIEEVAEIWVTRDLAVMAGETVLAGGSSTPRFIREVVFGRRKGYRQRFFQLTTDPVRQPPATTWYIVTNLPGKIEQTVGDLYGWRTWIEYGFKQAKDELGWADYRLTDAANIERWWELVMCAYLLVSLQAPVFAAAPIEEEAARAPAPPTQHPAWTEDASWKHRLNNFRLLLQPFVCACLLLPWLRLYPLPHLATGLADLCALMNTYHPLFPT